MSHINDETAATVINQLCLASIGGVFVPCKVFFYVLRLALQIYVHYRFCQWVLRLIRLQKGPI